MVKIFRGFNKINEDVEDLQELSPDTLKRYKDKAVDQKKAVNKQIKRDFDGISKDSKAYYYGEPREKGQRRDQRIRSNMKTSDKRQKGIDAASRKLKNASPRQKYDAYKKKGGTLDFNKWRSRYSQDEFKYYNR